MTKNEILDLAFSKNSVPESGDDSVIASNLLDGIKLGMFVERNWSFLLDYVQSFDKLKTISTLGYRYQYKLNDAYLRTPVAFNIKSSNFLEIEQIASLPVEEALKFGYAISRFPSGSGSYGSQHYDFAYTKPIFSVNCEADDILAVYDKDYSELPEDVALYLTWSLAITIRRSIFKQEDMPPDWVDDKETMYNKCFNRYFLPHGNYPGVHDGSIKRFLKLNAAGEFNGNPYF